MSSRDLKILLTDASHNGAAYLDVSTRELLVETATELGRTVITIDFAGISTKAAALSAIAHAMRFPPWFGENWDALMDCLLDMSWWPAHGYLILIENSLELRLQEPEDYDTLYAIFGQCAAIWAEQDVSFWTVFLVPLDQ